MRLLFVVTEAESYAVMLFSRLLKDLGHQVSLVFDPRLFANDEISNNLLSLIFDIRKKNLETIRKLTPDYIGFSCYTQDYKWTLEFANEVKKVSDAPIIFGGIHCVLCPEEVMADGVADIVCVGEGEKAIIELAGGQSPPIANLWFKGQSPPSLNPLIDLDSLPCPDKDIFYTQKPVFKKGYTIATSRGCPYSCAFCASDALNKKYEYKYLRQRSVEHVIGELLMAKERYHFKNVYFTDDNLTLKSSWLRIFARDYRRFINLPFYCTANPATIKPEQIESLAKAGCQMIGFGLQSASERVRVKVLNRRGSNESISMAARHCRKLGIAYSFDHICGIPGEVIDVDALRFYNDVRPNVINTFDLVYLPKTQLTEKYGETQDTSMLKRTADWFSSMCALMPLLPRWVNKLLIKSGLYKFVKFSHLSRMILKDISRALIGRWSDILFPIQLLVVNMRDNIRIKYAKRY